MKNKSLESLIFSAEFEQGVQEAVRKAVAEADAAGLRPAYEPAFSRLRELERKGKLAQEEVLEARRLARAEKAQRDQANLEFHQAVVELLYQPGQPGAWIKRKALETVQKWEDGQLCNPRYIVAWRQWLDMPYEYAKAAILREDDVGLSMRCNSPFFFLHSQEPEQEK